MGSLLLLGAFSAVVVITLTYAGRETSLLLRNLRKPRQRQQKAPTKTLPTVTVQIPLYNEAETANRIIDAVVSQDYPAHLVDIQVLDDSDDQTATIVGNTVEALKRAGYQIAHIRRPIRTGYKAGALAHGLQLSQGELVAVFDADFVPAPDFLRRIIVSESAFADKRVAFVQARWGYLNESENLLTRVQSLLLDRHFLLEKPVREASGSCVHFNGSAGIWRREAIADAGGWSGETLTEDLDLSVRCSLQGWRGAYLGHVAVPSEIPNNLRAFKTQQQRWAKGSAQCARKLFGSIAKAEWPRIRRFDELLYAAGYIVHPMALTHVLLWPWLVIHAGQVPLFIATQTIIGIATLAMPISLFVVGRLRNTAPSKLALQLFVGVALGLGLMVSNSAAFLTGLTTRGGHFMRTPKTASQGAENKQPQHIHLHWTFWGELATGLYSIAAAAYLLSNGYGLWALAPAFWAGCFAMMVAWQLSHAKPA